MLAAAFSSASLFAGSGVQAWQPSRAADPAPMSAVRMPHQHCPGCSGMKDVAVTVLRPSWPNRRGPLAPAVEMQRQVCVDCAGPMMLLAPGWPNRRGPLTPVGEPARHVSEARVSSR